MQNATQPLIKKLIYIANNARGAAPPFQWRKHKDPYIAFLVKKEPFN